MLIFENYLIEKQSSLGASKRRLRMITVLISASIMLILVLNNGIESAFSMDRWYSDEQVKMGGGLYDKTCAECHGSEAQGTLELKNSDRESFVPSPPLDGSAHTWHHSIEILKHTIREGGAKLGGKMPAAGKNFSDNQLESIVAYFQSKWPDEIYGRWEEVNKKPMIHVSNMGSDEKKDSDDVLVLLRALMPESNIEKPTKTPAKELLRINIDGHYAYITKDGKYALIGSLIDLSDGADLTEHARKADRIRAIEDYSVKDMIVYPSSGEEKSIITVFTDSSCPYCKKLHQEISILQEAGITVRYIAFPRGGPGSDGFIQMRSVWCDTNRVKAMNIVMDIAQGTLGDGNCTEADAVTSGYRLGSNLGVKGTPSIVLENGQLLPGYIPAIKLISLAINAKNSR